MANMQSSLATAAGGENPTGRENYAQALLPGDRGKNLIGKDLASTIHLPEPLHAASTSHEDIQMATTLKVADEAQAFAAIKATEEGQANEA